MGITNLVEMNLPVPRKTNPRGGCYVCCPMCVSMGESRNDTKFRGGFTPTGAGFMYHCYNCGFSIVYEEDTRVSQKMMKFLTTLGVDSKKIPIALRLLPTGQKLNKKVSIGKTPDLILDFDTVKLPDGSRPFEEWMQEEKPPELFIKALEYLISRGDAAFNGWKYYWSDSLKYSLNKRIIIPFYNNGMIVGYTCRSVDRTLRTKYWHKKPDDYMFAQDRLFNDNPVVLLVEGVFDAIVIKGVAVLGNHLSDKQINILKASKKRIILVPDRNKAGRTLMEQFIELRWEVSIPHWDRSVVDVAEASKRYGRLYTLKSILDSAISDRFKIETYFGLSLI